MENLFQKLEQVDERQDIEFEKKLKHFDAILKHIWVGARLNMENKKLMLRAPEIAKNTAIVLELGARPKAVEDLAKTGTK